MPKPKDKLEPYRAKRGASSTPEPFGGEAVGQERDPALRPRLFVIQQHAARRLHYDFRLEWGGVLWSWAVPKGPCLDPSVKRFAVHVEDHPVDYSDFEGVIPEGNYGAGEVIVWDTGRWIPLEDPAAGIESGKLLFDLDGYKLRGTWTLVRTGGRKNPDSRDWLLIKKPDGYSKEGDEPFPDDTSVFSGLTVEDLRQGTTRAEAIEKKLAKRRVHRGDVELSKLSPMLAEVVDEPFDGRAWWFELKYDGFRVIAERRGSDVKLRYRSGLDATVFYPEIVRSVRALPFDHFILDGEAVVLDPDARPNFQRLQKRAQLSRQRDVARAAVEHPVTYYAFDLLSFGAFDLRSSPLKMRREFLTEILPPRGALRFSDHVVGKGRALYEQIQAMGLEGIMAKRADSPYSEFRSPDWKKLRVERTEDFVVVGYSLPKGSRSGFGALHLARYVDDELTYRGRVGSGFNEATLEGTAEALRRIERDTPAFVSQGPMPKGTSHRWVKPILVCEVRYRHLTDEGNLRLPVFERMRPDKGPAECVENVSGDASAESVEEVAPAPREVNFTNLKKVFWPEEGYTKGDLIEFYDMVAPWLLPYLEDRPVVLTRYPDGIHGKSFFQKDAPTWVPDWIRLETMWSDHAKRVIHYFVVEDAESLTFLANLGTIPLHVWSSRTHRLGKPDWCTIDLDPKDASFEDVIVVAKTIKSLCDSVDLPAYVKTSGSTGLHVLIPLGAQLTHEQCRQLGHVISQVVCSEIPEVATLERVIGRRAGRVYLDYLQNGHGKLIVSPFCVRPLPGAPVSTPLRWREVKRGLSLSDYTIKSVPKRLKRMKDDPLLGVLEDSPDLLGALSKLGEMVAEAG